MTHTILIYELIPEELKVYLIPDEDILEEFRAQLDAADQMTVNVDDSTDELEAVIDWLESQDSDKYLTKASKVNLEVSHLYRIGFFL